MLAEGAMRATNDVMRRFSAGTHGTEWANPRVLSTVGALTAAAWGGAAGVISAGIISLFAPHEANPDVLISLITGVGSAVLSAGAGFSGRQVPIELHDLAKITHARPVNMQGMWVTVPPGRLLLATTPQEEYARDLQVFSNDPSAILRLKPRAAPSDEDNPMLHTVITHGIPRYAQVATGINGQVIRPMEFKRFAKYVNMALSDLDTDKSIAIKLVSCYGADTSLFWKANAQVLADKTGRTVYARPGPVGADDSKWTKFRPRVRSSRIPRLPGSRNSAYQRIRRANR